MVTETFNSFAFASAAATMILILARSRYFLFGRSLAKAVTDVRRIAAKSRFTSSSGKLPSQSTRAVPLSSAADLPQHGARRSLHQVTRSAQFEPLFSGLRWSMIL